MERERPSLLADLLGLVLPRECAGCGRPDRVLCRHCLRHFGEGHRVEQLAPEMPPDLPTWAPALYAGPVRHAILAWKSGGRPDLELPLTTAAAAAAAALAPQVRALAGTGQIAVIPAPSAAARRRSGRFVVGSIADAVATALVAHTGSGVLVLDVLRRRSSAGHLLSAADRSADRRRSVRAVTSLPATLIPVLVDDVLTTGATLRRCAQVLSNAGAAPIAALALAVTPPPGTTAATWRHDSL